MALGVFGLRFVLGCSGRGFLNVFLRSLCVD